MPRTRERFPRVAKDAAINAIREELLHGRPSVTTNNFCRGWPPYMSSHRQQRQSMRHNVKPHPQVLKPEGAQTTPPYTQWNAHPQRVNTSEAPPPATPPHPPPPPAPTVVPLKSLSPKEESLPTAPQNSGTTAPSVGLLQPRSPWLRKDGVCIAVFQDNSVGLKGVS